MHETSLIQFTLDAVDKKCQELQIPKVQKITLVVGDLRGAIPVLMEEAFQILTRRRPLFHGTQLEILTRPVLLACQDCGETFTVPELHNVHCPACQSPNYRIVQGNELYIESFEAE